MSEDPNDRAARLAGRWGGESDEEAEDGVEEGQGQEEIEESQDNVEESRDQGAESDGEPEVASEPARSEGQDGGREGEDAVDSKVGDEGSGDASGGTDQVDGGGDGGREGGDGGREAGDGGREAGDEPSLTTREMQSQMLYLAPEFHKEVDLTFEELNLRFRRERDRKLEKNKDFYAGLLRLGLERLGDVRDRDLDEVEELLDL